MIEAIAFLILWPILLLEAIYAHITTPRLAEPDGAHAGQTKPSGQTPLRLLIAGDSAAAGVGVAHQEQALSGRLISILADDFDISWQLIAKSGDTTADLIHHLQSLPQQTFDIAVLSLGVNDILSLRSCRTWIKQQRQLIELLETDCHIQRIIFTAVPPLHKFPALPQPLRWFLGLRAKKFTSALAHELHTRSKHHLFQMNFIQGDGVLASDGFHPGWKTYLYWGNEVAQIIKNKN